MMSWTEMDKKPTAGLSYVVSDSDGVYYVTPYPHQLRKGTVVYKVNLTRFIQGGGRRTDDVFLKYEISRVEGNEVLLGLASGGEKLSVVPLDVLTSIESFTDACENSTNQVVIRRGAAVAATEEYEFVWLMAIEIASWHGNCRESSKGVSEPTLCADTVEVNTR